MLVSEVIDRTFNEWLYPSGINRPTYDKLNGSVDASTLTIPLRGRVNNVPRDSVLEIENEQILVDSVSGSVVTAAAGGRGWLETGPASHADNSLVWVDPTFTRKSVFNALLTTLGALYPAGVYARLVDTATPFSHTNPTKDLPAGGKRLISISVRSTGSVIRWNTLRKGIDYKEHREFTPPKYELFRGGSEGAVMQVVYAADFTLPTAESDDLSSLAAPVPDTLQPYLGMGIAGYLLQSREVPRVQIEEIRRRLALEGVQVGSALNVGQSLLNGYRSLYVAAERERLKELDQSELEFTRR